MKERALLLALAAGALALFYVLLFPKPGAEVATQGLPLSTETRSDGYQALWQWLAEQRIPAVSLRYRYDRLHTLPRKSIGNVLIISMPQRVPARAAELDSLRAWVQAGNTLLIMAALDDRPLWTLGEDPLFEERLERITGLRFNTPNAARLDLHALTTRGFTVLPRGTHPLTAAVQRLTALSALPPQTARPAAGHAALALELATRNDTGDTTLWLLRAQRGQILLSTAASLFANGAVSLTDNARLLANILAWSLEPGGTVIFDDAHQGAAQYYDGAHFFADPRLHHTLVWILVLWLMLVLGAQPLRALRNTWRPLDETAYVEASARYFAAVVPRGAAAQSLIEGFLRHLTRSGSGPSSPWELLDAHAGVSARERSELRHAYSRACAGQPVDLVRLQNLLAHLRRIFE